VKAFINIGFYMLNNSNFVKIKLNSDTLDVYYVRKSIFMALKQTLPLLNGVILDVGCGEMPYKSFILNNNTSIVKYIGLDIATDMYNKIKPDLVWDGKTIPLGDHSIDCAVASELFEHCPEPEIVMSEVDRVLKPGGLFFFTVPFLWPLHDVPYDQYRYTPFSLERHLRCSGFCQIEIKALGGWDASFAQMIGLWVNRRPLPTIIKKLLQFFARPLIHFLVNNDKIPLNFSESMMITGFHGTAKKNSISTVGQNK
jgi:SAM-dependent methyltransferase